MTGSLLPANATALERALEGAMAPAYELPVDIPAVWNPETCPAELLPWLAWAWSVDTWSDTWSERTKLNVIAASYKVHRHKGTVASIKAAIESAGFPEPVILERLGNRKYDGAINHDGRFFYGWDRAWALYRVKLPRPIRNDQVATVRAILAATAPARSELLSLEYQEVANLYDGASAYDGAYNHGRAA